MTNSRLVNVLACPPSKIEKGGLIWSVAINSLRINKKKAQTCLEKIKPVEEMNQKSIQNAKASI